MFLRKNHRRCCHGPKTKRSLLQAAFLVCLIIAPSSALGDSTDETESTHERAAPPLRGHRNCVHVGDAPRVVTPCDSLIARNTTPPSVSERFVEQPPAKMPDYVEPATHPIEIKKKQTPALVRTKFYARSDDQRFTIDANEQVCQTPCVLALPAGPLLLNIDGTSSYRQRLDLPAGGSVSVEVNAFRGSRLGWGITLLVLSGASLGFGGVLFAAGIEPTPSCSDLGCALFLPGLIQLKLTMLIGGSVLLAAGGALGGGGISLLARTGRNEASVTGRSPPPILLTSVHFAPVPGGGAVAGLALSF